MNDDAIGVLEGCEIGSRNKKIQSGVQKKYLRQSENSLDVRSTSD